MDAAYEFSCLGGGYGGKEVIRKISGRIRRGKVTALIGPNGCGKSTLIKLLSGKLPHTGELSLFRHSLGSHAPRELSRLVGVVPQNTHIAQGFTVYDVIGFGRLPHVKLLSPLSRQDELEMLKAAESAGVEHLLIRQMSSLSGGERQRVVMAMVMAQNPRVFLLDEPTSSLDPMHSVKIFKIMRALALEGKSVIAAAHDINTAIVHSDDYIALKDGEIVSSGEMKSIDGEILSLLYETKFFAYRSERGETAWHSDA